ELFKLFIQKSTWIMFIALIVLLLGNGIITKIYSEDYLNNYSDDWKAELQAENKELEKEIKEASDGDPMIEIQQEELNENNYYLEHDIKPTNYGALQFVYDNHDFLSVVSLLTIIVSAGIIANEFRWGTIKLLLIRPVSRTKILFSKYFSTLFFALGALLFILVVSWLIGVVLFYFDGMNTKTLHFGSDCIEYKSVLLQFSSGYGYKLVNLVMIATFAFLISAVFRNSSLAIGIAIFLMFAGNTIVAAFSQHSWAKFILFANTDLQQYQTNNVFIEGMTLSFSISVLIVYYIVFIVLAWIFFTKRDVAGT